MSLEWKELRKSVKMDAEKGLIFFRGNRLLLFHANALSQLKDELIKTLGFDLARGVFLRFGYRCGFSDAQSVKNIFDLETDAEWMLAGPIIHTLEGLVHVSNQILDYKRETGHFYMKGIWENSYEAEEYLKQYGPSAEAVCWTLAGYASGYSTGFFGQETVCIETKCIAKGDPCCEYEIRTKNEWSGVDYKYWGDLEPNTVVKSLQNLLKEERDRVNQWKTLNEIVLFLSNGLNFSETEKDFYQQVCQLFFAEKALLVINNEETEGYKVFEYSLGANSIVKKTLNKAEGLISSLLNYGSPLRSDGSNFPNELQGVIPIKDFLGVPLVSNGRQLGSLIVADKYSAHGFTEYDQNILILLGTQAAMVIENTKLYRMTDQKLKEKNDELNRINEYLVEQHRLLQQSAELHDRLTGLVLEDAGLQRIVNSISHTLGLPVLIEDKEYKVLAIARKGDYDYISSGSLLNKLSSQITSDNELKKLKTGREPAVFQVADDSGNVRRRCLTPITAGKEILGFLTVELKDSQLADDKKLMLRDASVVIALELLKQRVLIENRRRMIKDLLDEWLFSESFSEERVMAWSYKLALLLEFPISILVLEFEGNGIEQITKYVTDLTESLPSNGLFGFQDNKLVLLFCKDENNRLALEFAQKLEKGLKAYSSFNWWITVGSKSESVSEVRQSFDNACTANQIMKHLNKKNTCFNYENLGVYGMLEINPERFVWFVQRLLGEVVNYDKKHKTELIPTLKLYFKNNQNIQAAARQGFLNDGTLKYRLKRIQEIGKLDLTDSEVSLQVQLALKFL